MYNELVKKENTDVVNYKPHGSNVLNIKHKLALSKKPIEVTIGQILYRIIPQHSDVGISKSGIVIRLKDDTYVKRFPIGNYLGVTVMDYINSRILNAKVHRLVALAWCDNDDYVDKNLVDHIDQNKHNNNASNLEWVTASENLLRARRSKFKYIVTNNTKKHSIPCANLSNISDLLKLSIDTIGRKDMPFTVMVGVNEFTIEAINDKRLASRGTISNVNAFTVTSIGGGNPIHFANKGAVKTHFSIRCYPVTIKILAEHLHHMGYLLVDNKNVSKPNSYDILNLDTGTEHLGLDLKTVIATTEIPRGTVLSRLNRDYKYGQLLGSWVLKHKGTKQYEAVHGVGVCTHTVDIGKVTHKCCSQHRLNIITNKYT